MSYLYCEKCRELFSEDNIHWVVEEEVHWWLDDRPTEQFFFRLCPNCGSEDIEDAPTCKDCGDWFLPEDLDDDGLCIRCKSERETEREKEHEIELRKEMSKGSVGN